MILIFNVYFDELIEQCNGFGQKYGGIDNIQYLKENLTMNCIPDSIFSMDIDNYNEFLMQRRLLMAKKIKDFNLNPRQRKALEFLIEHKQIDNSIYQKICNTTKRTATRDLTDLVNLGLLVRHGEKKGTYYTIRRNRSSDKDIYFIRDTKGTI